MKIQLVPPTQRYRESFLHGLREFRHEGLPWWVGGDLETAEQDFAAFVGRISIHHELNDALHIEGGHIGYDTVPSSRDRGVATPGFASGSRARTDCSAPHVRRHERCLHPRHRKKRRLVAGDKGARHEQTTEALLLDHAVIAGSPASDQIDPYRPPPMTSPNNTLQLTSTSRASRSVVGLQLSLVPLAIQEQRVATWRPANRHVSSRLGVWGNSQLTSIV